MHRALLLAAFKKAEKETGSTIISRLATHISGYILEESGEGFGERSLRDYYKAAKEDKDDRIELRPFVVKALCAYLGYATFDEFNANYGKEATGKNKIGFRLARVHWIAIAVIVVCFGLFIALSDDAQRVMIWAEDHYEEVPLDVETYPLTDLKLYNEDRIQTFKKVKVDCESQFFDENGLALMWYGKNGKGELEYFTSLARHPETGKTLKKITPYMIRKYICESY